MDFVRTKFGTNAPLPVEHFFLTFPAHTKETSQKVRKKVFNWQRFICTKFTSYKIHILTNLALQKLAYLISQIMSGIWQNFLVSKHAFKPNLDFYLLSLLLSLWKTWFNQTVPKQPLIFFCPFFFLGWSLGHHGIYFFWCIHCLISKPTLPHTKYWSYQDSRSVQYFWWPGSWGMSCYSRSSSFQFCCQKHWILFATRFNVWRGWRDWKSLPFSSIRKIEPMIHSIIFYSYKISIFKYSEASHLSPMRFEYVKKFQTSQPCFVC